MDVSWAFIGQAVSSATTIIFLVLAGRALGASGLGVVAAGFAAYFVVLAVHRALVITPLISSTSSLVDAERRKATRAALSATLVIGGVAASASAIVGVAVGGNIGRSLLLFAPWSIPALTQGLFKASLFRDGRGLQATVSQVAWLGILVALAPAAMRIDSDWAIVGAWGLGGLVAALIATAWARVTPLPLSASLTWFLRVAFPFGRWLALQEGSIAAAGYGIALIVIAVLGAADLGGLRAAESIFAPFTLLAPALLLAALPAVARVLARSRRNAVRVVALISAVSVLGTVAYSLVMVAWGTAILTAVFGERFESYGSLVVPISAGQLALAGGYGFGILLLAEERGKAIFVAGGIFSTVSLVAGVSFAVLDGVRGAVWGISLAAFLAGIVVISLALRGPASTKEATHG